MVACNIGILRRLMRTARQCRGLDFLKGFDRLRAYVEHASKSPIVAATYKPPPGKDWIEEMKVVYKAYGGTPLDLYS